MDADAALTRLKFMVAATTDPLLDPDPDSVDDILAALLSPYAEREDPAGRAITDTNWTPTWDLEWAAAEVWAWKAGASADRYKIIGDGTELNRHQVHQHCLRLYDLYVKRASRRPWTIRMKGNLLVDRLSAYSTIPWWWEVSA